ncbi:MULTISPECIES: hypothetical protein [Acidithiobacillus]|jgi:hypothetical protein|uniref:Lipoprotein n=3 Tax=Acidithiobacillus caldus TaxID=33059 RepID=F9ZPT5_ACICS|nr:MULTISPECIES: hypothetical protein [Acidithiobacillus]AEK58498.1 conserved hypothetical protein [Acidithiobacillus caldus SM-1]AIA55540.1 hypothetical protein Acaty_c1680 [Acidithiobacillus caldus ATCC 51756]MBU2730161.1 hypothetical protein [Acidithiobacillus caldus]MBU2736929.1 hypothetical protein [Acidithiobacillus caldus ATCC 51756]MBU2745756.1 hypothetical protein [Acidithiobacillus caldus]
MQRIFRSSHRAGMLIALTVGLLAGCSAKYGTQVPSMPISMGQAQAQANISQAGINVSRQFVTAWEAAKSNMKNSLEQCSLAAGSGYGSQQHCWQRMQTQATNYADQFAGMTVGGLTPAQERSFSLAQQAAVNFFHLSGSYASDCSISTQSCLHNNDLRMRMNAERKAVDDYLMHASVVPSQGNSLRYENNAVNDNLEQLQNPNMVPPAANRPAINASNQ